MILRNFKDSDPIFAFCIFFILQESLIGMTIIHFLTDNINN